MPNMTKVRAVPCEIFSRVVGYFRPVQNWNKGKRQEFAERVTLNLARLGVTAKGKRKEA